MILNNCIDYGDGLLTNKHTILFNGKEQVDVVHANNLLSYVDVWHKPYTINGIEVSTRRKFGGVVILYNGKQIFDKPFFAKEE